MRKSSEVVLKARCIYDSCMSSIHISGMPSFACEHNKLEGILQGI